MQYTITTKILRCNRSRDGVIVSYPRTMNNKTKTNSKPKHHSPEDARNRRCNRRVPEGTSTKKRQLLDLPTVLSEFFLGRKDKFEMGLQLTHGSAVWGDTILRKFLHHEKLSSFIKINLLAFHDSENFFLGGDV